MDSSSPKVITCKAAVVWKEGEMIKIEEIQVDPLNQMKFELRCSLPVCATPTFSLPMAIPILYFLEFLDMKELGYGATWREVHVEKGSTVAVLGLGAVGLGAIEGARSQGASKIIGVDINESKWGKGELFGMTDFINPKESKTSVSEMIKDVDEGLGVDYVFECTGIPSMLNEAIEASKLGIGTIVVIGAGHGLTREFNLVPLLCGRTLKGSIYGGIRLHSDLPAILHRCATKEIQLNELITHQISLTEINQSFELLKDPHCVKIIIKF